jgi:AhpC/TSA family
MKRLVFGLAACVGVALAALAPGVSADEPAQQAKGDPAKELTALQKEWSDAQEAFQKALQEAKTNEERQQVLKDKRPKAADFAERFLKLAEAYPKSPEAGQALGWLVTNARGTDAAKKAVDTLKEQLAAITDLEQLHQLVTPLPSYGLGELAPAVAEKARTKVEHPKAVPLLMWVCSATLYGPSKELAKLYNDTVDLLVDRFVERKELAPLPGYLGQDEDPAWAEKHLRRLAEKNPAADVKADARFNLAKVLKNKDETSQSEAEKLFQSYIDEFAQTPDQKQSVDQARKELDDLKLRGIGKPAPDIVGEDLDGKPFKLSDYKGKVVLLDFWGFW